MTKKQVHHEKKLPEKYNRKSTSKHKPTFHHIFHHFFSALVNTTTTTTTTATTTVLKADLYSTMAAWIDDGQGYLRYLDNKRGASEIYIQKELALFQQYLTPATFGRALQDLSFDAQHTIDANPNGITKLYIKKRVAYVLHYETIKTFLIKYDYYNRQYEHVPSSLSRLLPKLDTHPKTLASASSTAIKRQCDAIFYQFFQSILDSQPNQGDNNGDAPKLKFLKISGSNLFGKMRQYVFSKQRIVHDDDTTSPHPYPTALHTTLQTIRGALNTTMFGVNMNRLLIQPGTAIKKLTNTGTIYAIHLEKLSQLILEQTNEE